MPVRLSQMFTAPISSLDPAAPISRPDHEVAYAINRMSLGGYRHIPLVDRMGAPMGVISVKDVVNHLVGHFPQDIYNLPPEPDVHPVSREGA